MSDIKFCKEFLQQVSKLPLEYLEGYVEKRRGTATSVSRPSISKSASTVVASSTILGDDVKITLKKLGGVGKAHEVKMKAGSSVAFLRTEAGKLFAADNFTLMYKGRPLADDSAIISAAIPDPSTPVYVSIKTSSSTPDKAVPAKTPAKALPDAFWEDFRGLLAKHGAANADQIQARFRQDYLSWN